MVLPRGRTLSVLVIAGREVVCRSSAETTRVVIGRYVARSQPSYTSYTSLQTTPTYGDARVVPPRVRTLFVLVIAGREVIRRPKRRGSSSSSSGDFTSVIHSLFSLVGDP